MITSTKTFHHKCFARFKQWYEENKHIKLEDNQLFEVWSCKTLQNFKMLIGTTLPDGIYAEYTYNGDKDELYEDVYVKLSNVAIKPDSIKTKED